MPSPPFNHGFGNDVFVSYAHADNEPDPNGRCWVSEFASDLKRRLSQVSGRSVSIWRDDRLGAADILDREIGDQIARSAVLVPIISPNYLNSGPCDQERRAFVTSAGRGPGLSTGNKSRIVKVVKYPDDRRRYPAEFQDLLEHAFYVELTNGQPREFLLHEDSAVRARYLPRVDDVAYEITQVLRLLEQGTSPAPARATVYLATATSDLDDARDQIRRSLEQRGYDVLPSRALPLQGARLLEAVSSDLSQCRLSVHPVGAYFGVVPEQADGKSMARLQLECAAMADAALMRLIWIPEALVTDDSAQRAFIDEIRRQYPSLGFELVEATVQKLETHLRDRLEAPQQSVATEEDVARTPRVYVMCDARDRDSARLVRKSLLAKGLDVDFPPEAGEPAEVRELHQERLREAEAFVIFYGQSPDVWVQRQLGEVRKAAGLGRRGPILARRVFLAEPKTPDKEDLLANPALALDGFPPASPDDAIAPLVRDLTGEASREERTPGLRGAS